MTPATHGLGPTRARVLALLQQASSPVSVVTVADDLGLHRNSARFHLDALVNAGFASRSTAPTGQQGRPPQLFTATDAAPTLNNLHLLELSHMLLTELAISHPDPAAATAEMGRRWGSASATDSAGEGQQRDLGGLLDTLGARGFTTTRNGDDLLFERCPFRSQMDSEQLPLICSMHRGFLDGYLTAADTDLRTEVLEVGPSVCLARLAHENSQNSTATLPAD